MGNQEPFLKGDPAKVNTAEPWSQIPDAIKVTSLDSQTNKGVEDDSLVATDLWNLSFNSKYNAQQFPDPQPVDNTKQNNSGFTGDGLGSAVLVADDDQTAATDSISLYDVAKQFGIYDDENLGSAAQEFIKLIGESIKATPYQKKPTGAKDWPLAPSLTNAIWFLVLQDRYQVSYTLTFVFSIDQGTTSPLAQALGYVKTYTGLDISLSTVSNIYIPLTLTKNIFYSLDSAGALQSSANNILSYEFTINCFTAYIDLEQDSTTLLLCPTPANQQDALATGAPSITTLLSGIADGLSLPSGLPGDNPLFKDFFSHIYPWYVTVTLGDDGKPDWGIGLIAAWALGDDSSVVIAFTYDSATATFEGRLLFASDLPTTADFRNPMYDRRRAIPKLDGIPNPPPSLDLFRILTGKSTTFPVPTNLTKADIIYSTDTVNKSSTFSFAAALEAPTGQSYPLQGSSENHPVPLGGFKWQSVNVAAAITIGQVKSTGVSFSSVFALVDPAGLYPSADFLMTLQYSSVGSTSSWLLHGRTDNLSVGLLGDFFHADCSSGAMKVLGGLNLAYLDALFVYSSDSSGQKTSASSFLISGALTFGDLELELSYQYVSKAQDTNQKTAAELKWDDPSTPPPKNVTALKTSGGKDYAFRFEAYLKTPASSTLGSIADSIVPGCADSLPGFVRDIEIAGKDLKGSVAEPIKVKYTGSQASSTFMAFIGIGPINMTFIQRHDTPTDTQGDVGPVKILRISVDAIPMIEDIPVVGKLPQPFDHLVYCWCQVDEKLNKDNGIKRSTLQDINNELQQIDVDIIQRKEKANPQPNDIELLDGHHFIVVVSGSVILDHVFGASNTNPNPTPATSGPAPATATNTTERADVTAPSGSSGTDATAVPVPPPTKGTTTRKVGPLSLSALSLQFKNGTLEVGIDATLTLGPLALTVRGFTISIETNNKDHPLRLDSLGSIITDGLVHAAIRGLDIYLNKTPLTIAGGFEEGVMTLPDGTSERYYRGGVCVGIEAWKLLAIGQYSIVTSKNGKYKSVFIYARLDGPLIELEFATIAGVRLGFGYNSGVHNPTLDQLDRFPFISDSGMGSAGSDPMAILSVLLGGSDGADPFVYAKEGLGWFCMGFTITAFDCVTLTTVAILEVDTDPQHRGVIVSLFADGIVQMEPAAPIDLSLFYIELLIMVEMNFIEGYIAANASLAPQSHVYVPNAHLTGQASFYSWFGNNPHAGDWVVSLGGYHRSFARPSFYPNPKRLGLNFALGSSIQVTGNIYLAVTPKCAMAGGLLHFSVAAGPVSAWLDLVLDVFINFKPFFFVATISLSVGCAFECDIWFVHVHFEVHVGADLTVWGPDKFGGIAHVDMWFHSFAISFGADVDNSSTVTLQQFYDIVRKSGPASDPPVGDTSATQFGDGISLLKMSVEEGLAPKKPDAPTSGAGSPAATPFPSTGVGEPWKILNGKFVFRIDADIPIRDVYLGDAPPTDGSKDPDPATLLTSDPTTINSCPMRKEITKSNLYYKVVSREASSVNAQPEAGFTVELVTKALPFSLWKEWVQSEDPLFNPSPTTLTETGTKASISHSVSLRVTSPDPQLARPDILEMDAVLAMEYVLPNNQPTVHSYQIPIPTRDEESALEAAERKALPQVIEPANGLNAWDVFAKMWNTNGNQLGDDVLELCATTLQWNRRPPGETPSDVGLVPEWSLTGKPPSQLIDMVDVYYEQLPQQQTL